MYAFEFSKPTSVSEAVAAFGRVDEGKYLAGGQTLLPTMKQRLAAPSDLIDLASIRDLAGIREEADGIVIGAMTTHADVAGSDAIGRVIPALADLADGIGDAQVRNRGTIGGSIANNDPAADYPAGLVGLNATIHTDRRTLAADDFFLGLFETALEDGELVTSVKVTVPDRAAYVKFPNPASRYALVGVFVAQSGAGVRVAVTGCGANGVFRVPEMEAALQANFAPAAVDGIKVDAGSLNGDIHGSPEYRAHLVTVLAKRAVAAAR